MAKIDDVARLARVSKGTVSNVFSRKRPISEDVRRRVLEASKQLNYVPNAIARSLVTKQTMTIGLNIPFGHNMFFNSFQIRLMNGVVHEASKNNYRILLDTFSQEEVDLPYLSSFPIDGAILIDPKQEDHRINNLNQFRLPFVVIGTPSNSQINDLVCVDNDNVKVGYNACRYLIEKGHRRILFLNAPEIMTVSLDRKRGFEQALSDCRIAQDACLHRYKPNVKLPAFDFGYETTLQIFGEQKNAATAIIADEEDVAAGVLRALSALDLRVPQDVSVLVISGDPDAAHRTEPPLTTMDLQASLLGSHAVRIVLDMLNGKEVPSRTIVKARIIEKGSCIAV